MSTEPALVLSYGKKPAQLWRKTSGYLLLSAFLGLTLSLTPAAWRHVEDWLARRRYLAAQEIALTYTAPPDQIAFTDDPGRIASLKSISLYDRSKNVPDAVLLYEQLPWANLMDASKVYSLYPIISPPSTPSLFLHKLTSPAGHQRLVYIGVSPPEEGPSAIQTVLTRQVFSLATSSAAPKNLSTSSGLYTGLYAFSLNRNRPPEPLTLFEGQPDSADPSHFTIPFQFRGTLRAIDGYLQDDDTVVLDPHLGYERTAASGRDDGFPIDRYASRKIPFGKPVFAFNGGKGPVGVGVPATYRACAFSPDGKFLAVSSETAPQIRLLDMATRKTIREFHYKYAMTSPTGMAFTPDGKTLVTVANHYGDLMSWDVQSGEAINLARGSDDRIETFSFSNDGRTLLAKTSMSRTYTFTLPDLSLVNSDLTRNLLAGEVLSNGRHIKYYQNVAWRPAPGTVFPNDLSYRSPGEAVMSPDGQAFAVGDTYSLNLLDHTGKYILAREVYEPVRRGIINYRAAGFSPDGKLLGVIVDNHGLCLWQLPDADTVYDWPTPNPLLGFTFSPDRRYLATIDSSDTLSIWDLDALK